MPPPPRPGRLWLVAVGVLALAVAVNLGTPLVAAAAFRGYLMALLPSRALDVRLMAWPPLALWWGRVDLLTVAADDVQIGTLQLARFDARLSDMRFDPKALLVQHRVVIDSVRLGVAQATVSQAELAHALVLQPNVRVDSIVLRRDQVLLKGAVRVLGAELPADGVGHLVLNGDTAIDLVLDRVTVAGGAVSMPNGGPALTLKSVIAVPPLPFGFRLTAVRTDDGKLVLDAGTGSS
ncbi:MAG TPA: DUF2993 domain-containing protein [bacterium]|nr:DUF2993 domain-containing protein [bacterium]